MMKNLPSMKFTASDVSIHKDADSNDSTDAEYSNETFVDANVLA